MPLTIPITTTSPRGRFLEVYRALLVARYAWAADAAKLDKYMASVEETISTTRSTWNHVGDAVTEAWQALGHTSKPTLKALRALPL